MNHDFVEMLSALSAAGAEFLLVGAHALAVHGRPRATGDLDLWVRPTLANARRVIEALHTFGAPLLGLTEEDLVHPGTVFQVGVVPCRIDLLTSIDGVAFPPAWDRRVVMTIEGVAVPCIGRDDFLANKRAVGRPRDLADVAELESEEDDPR